MENSLPDSAAYAPVAADTPISIGSADWWMPARLDEPELLDQGIGSTDDVRINLQEMWQINRRFGGVEALTRHLYPLLRSHTAPLCLVDLGTGSGEIPLLIARNGPVPLTIYGVDCSGRNLAAAQDTLGATPDVHLIQADVNKLPFAADQVDYYLSTLFLHHFAPDQVIKLLRETYQRARRGIIMSDLVRGYLPLIAFKLIQPLFARHYLTRHDGMLSIKRAYSPDELLMLARAAGLETARLYRHFPWRMTLVAEKPID